MVIWLIEERNFERLKPYFPKSQGKPRVDDQLVISGIAYVPRNGLRWKDASRGIRSIQDVVQPFRPME